ncbi:MAG: ABC transporter permease [Pelolinea sp.]|jgi:simple sugar transport system permease protein|nr:ABC transporter permease [Pelolinea sp.]
MAVKEKKIGFAKRLPSSAVFSIASTVGALLFTSFILWMAGAQPGLTFEKILAGAFGDSVKIANGLVVWVPLSLTAGALIITFTAGLWNLGIEGQIMLGAIAATGTLRVLQNSLLSPVLIILFACLMGMVGGALWAALTGILRLFGGVSEIFAGVGLNFVATALSLWLIFDPWKRPGVGSMSGTEPFDERLWLATIPGYRLSLWSLVLVVVVFIGLFILLKKTRFGIQIKAIGKNLEAARLMGIQTRKQMMAAMLLCGGLAGLAGALQVVAVYHRLIPSISSGYGFLAMLVAMLANNNLMLALLVAYLFAILNIGGIQLPIVLHLDSTLSGVLQTALVLFFLIMNGVKQHLTERKERNRHAE